MGFIRTRSGRYINIDFIVYISVEETRITDKGKKIEVYNLVAYLPAPMSPAVLGIFREEAKAFSVLERLMQEITEGAKLISVPTDF